MGRPRRRCKPGLSTLTPPAPPWNADWGRLAASVITSPPPSSPRRISQHLAAASVSSLQRLRRAARRCHCRRLHKTVTSTVVGGAAVGGRMGRRSDGGSMCMCLCVCVCVRTCVYAFESGRVLLLRRRLRLRRRWSRGVFDPPSSAYLAFKGLPLLCLRFGWAALLAL